MGRQDPPTLHDLIVFTASGALRRRSVLTRTKLVKLLYLLDVDLATAKREPVTGLVWRFLHYGPYAPELGAKLEEMEDRSIWSKQAGNAMLIVRTTDAPDSQWWPGMLETRADRLLDKWAPANLNELLDYVYFHTGPMAHAKRGERLDLGLAARPSITVPLEPPAAPPDVHERVAQWRQRQRARFIDLPAELRGNVVDLPPEPPIPHGTRVVAHVADHPED